MKIERAQEIFNSYKIYDVYFENEPVWIQEINNNFAKIGFIQNKVDKNIEISNLYEK